MIYIIYIFMYIHTGISTIHRDQSSPSNWKNHVLALSTLQCRVLKQIGPRSTMIAHWDCLEVQMMKLGVFGEDEGFRFAACFRYCICSSRKLGKMKPFWRAYFSNGLVHNLRCERSLHGVKISQGVMKKKHPSILRQESNNGNVSPFFSPLSGWFGLILPWHLYL